MTRSGAARLAALGIGAALIATSCSRDEPREIHAAPLPDDVRAERARAARPSAALGGDATRASTRILFGDLHVHTTLSADAFFMALPIMGGSGAHPPAEACDFARFCSGLDFFGYTDHAMSILPDDWEELKRSARECSAAGGPDDDPDLVAFAGWEWTQVGASAADHYGHKNVIFRDTDDAQLPARPIGAASALLEGTAGPTVDLLLLAATLQPGDADTYLAYRRRLKGMLALDRCPEGVPVRELPVDCREETHDAAGLFDKLDDWGFESLVIPHGNAWGLHVPGRASWESQLVETQQDPRRQRLIEVYSGHGNSEEYRPFRAWEEGPDGRVCPAPTEGYLPCCWQAGEIVRGRCAEPGSESCEAEVAAARSAYIDLDVFGWRAVPDTEPSDWLDCGQCRDCFLPAFQYRPMASAQHALALGGFGVEQDPLRYRFGFIGSSDNHKAQPGTGYRERRDAYSERFGPDDSLTRWFFNLGARREGSTNVGAWEFERQGSYWYTGGLVAVHARDRSREAIWEALEERRVYGTSGDRMLLWFELLDSDGGPPRPMGSELRTDEPPRFEVRAAGALEQAPGCPEAIVSAAGTGLIEDPCRGDCYHPTDTRHRIDRIEVVRIRPQVRAGEAVDPLIEDPWMVLPCPDDPTGCRVRFEDPDFPASGRPAVYYVRAVQAATPAVNGDGLRCEHDGGAPCSSVDPCYADPRTDVNDDCLAAVGERAWSSPIFLDPPGSG